MLRVRFSTVIVPTRDVPKMRKFYEELFGFRLNDRTGDGEYRPGINWAELEAPEQDPGEPDLELLEIGEHVLPASAAAGPPGGCIFAFRVDDIREAAAFLQDKGVPLSSEIYEEGWGWFFYFHDPDGNGLELFQYRAGSWAQPDQGP